MLVLFLGGGGMREAGFKDCIIAYQTTNVSIKLCRYNFCSIQKHQAADKSQGQSIKLTAGYIKVIFHAVNAVVVVKKLGRLLSTVKSVTRVERADLLQIARKLSKYLLLPPTCW